MKKLFLTAVIFAASGVLFAEDDCGGNVCQVKMPGTGIDLSAYGGRKKEADKETKEIEGLVEKYKASPSDGTKKELAKKLVLRKEKQIKTQREDIARQQEKLKTWSANLDGQEKNVPAAVEQEIKDLVSGKKELSPWDKLKDNADKQSETLKRKSLKKAAEVKK